MQGFSSGWSGPLGEGGNVTTAANLDARRCTPACNKRQVGKEGNNSTPMLKQKCVGRGRIRACREGC